MKNVFIRGGLQGLFAVLVITLASTALQGAPAKKETNTEQKIVCEKTESVQKTMDEKNFFLLLNMTNDSGVVESVWISGTTIVITAQKGEDSCFLAMMSDVTYNPDTLQGLVKAYEAQKGKQKDI